MIVDENLDTLHKIAIYLGQDVNITTNDLWLKRIIETNRGNLIQGTSYLEIFAKLVTRTNELEIINGNLWQTIAYSLEITETVNGSWLEAIYVFIKNLNDRGNPGKEYSTGK